MPHFFTRNSNFKRTLLQGGQLHSGDSIDQVLSHEVKELGTHILVCEVSYSAPGKSKMNFRKFFKFNVMKPLDVKTKFYNAEVSN